MDNNLTPAQRLQQLHKKSTYVLELQLKPSESAETIETLKAIAENCNSEELALLKTLALDESKRKKVMAYKSWLT